MLVKIQFYRLRYRICIFWSKQIYGICYNGAQILDIKDFENVHPGDPWFYSEPVSCWKKPLHIFRSWCCCLGEEREI